MADEVASLFVSIGAEIGGFQTGLSQVQTGTGGSAGLGARAFGGPVSANQPYLTGERGVELFWPSTSGHILSNRDLRGMGGGQPIIVQQTIYGSSPRDVARMVKMAIEEEDY